MSSFPLNMLPQLKRCLLTLGYNFGLSCQFKITEFQKSIERGSGNCALLWGAFCCHLVSLFTQSQSSESVARQPMQPSHITRKESSAVNFSHPYFTFQYILQQYLTRKEAFLINLFFSSQYSTFEFCTIENSLKTKQKKTK